MSITVLFEDEPHVAERAREDGGRLLLDAADLEAATGWALKPEGLCRADACVPLPADGSWQDADGRVDLVAFAERLGRPAVRDEDHGIWAFGEGVGPRGVTAPSAQAPDIALPDLDGRMHALSDFRGMKLFLYSWGSY